MEKLSDVGFEFPSANYARVNGHFVRKVGMRSSGGSLQGSAMDKNGGFAAWQRGSEV
jgi:hypothetical protein